MMNYFIAFVKILNKYALGLMIFNIDFFYLCQKRRDLVNRLTICYFDTEEFLPTKTFPP